MPGPKCSPKVAAAADHMVKKPNLTAKDAMHLAGFSPYECECRKLQKRVNQKKLRVLKASKELVMVPKEKRVRIKVNTVHKNIFMFYGNRMPLVFDPMLIFPSGSPRVSLAAAYLIINPYLSVEHSMRSAGFINEEYTSRKKQSNVSMKKIRLLKAFSKLQLHIPKLDFPNPLLGYKTMVRYT
jgi:hypothetical protein